MTSEDKNTVARRMINVRAMTHQRILRLKFLLIELCSKKRENSGVLLLDLPTRELSISDVLDMLCAIAEPKIEEMLK